MSIAQDTTEVPMSLPRRGSIHGAKNHMDICRNATLNKDRERMVYQGGPSVRMKEGSGKT